MYDILGLLLIHTLVCVLVEKLVSVLFLTLDYEAFCPRPATF